MVHIVPMSCSGGVPCSVRDFLEGCSVLLTFTLLCLVVYPPLLPNELLGLGVIQGKLCLVLDSLEGIDSFHSFIFEVKRSQYCWTLRVVSQERRNLSQNL